MACLSGVDFFLTQRLKCFYLKHLFTFQSPKKKKKKPTQPSSRPISVPSRVTDTASELLRGNILTFLALSPSCWGDSHLSPASMDRTAAQKARQRGGDRDPEKGASWGLSRAGRPREHVGEWGPSLQGFRDLTLKEMNEQAEETLSQLLAATSRKGR